MPLSKLEAPKVGEWNQMTDVNIRGVLHGIAAGLPIMQQQRSVHFVNEGHAVYPTSAVYSATKFAVLAISVGPRQEVGGHIRVTVISPGVSTSELAETISDDGARQVLKDFRQIAIPADAIVRSIAFAIEHPGCRREGMIIRPTASVS